MQARPRGGRVRTVGARMRRGRPAAPRHDRPGARDSGYPTSCRRRGVPPRAPPRAGESSDRAARDLGNPAAHIGADRVESLALATGLKMRKKGAASAPQPATHCQPRVLLARSASTSVSQNQRAPFAPQAAADPSPETTPQSCARDCASSRCAIARASRHRRWDSRCAPRCQARSAAAARPPGEACEIRAQRLLGRMRKVVKQVIARTRASRSR